MIEIGRLCRKIAGRDAGLTCVVLDIDKTGMCLIDGVTRRRKCNIRHLIALPQKLDIAKGASHDTVLAALKDLGIVGRTTKPKAEKPGRVKAKPAKQAPEAKEKTPKEKAEKGKEEKAKEKPKKEAKEEKEDKAE